MKYTVRICRTTEEYVDIDVEADSPDEAGTKADDEVFSSDDLIWNITDTDSWVAGIRDETGTSIAPDFIGV